MLSPGELFSHRSNGVSQHGFTDSLRPNHSPSVYASVTSVRCFPLASRSRTEAVASPTRLHSQPPSQSFPSVASVTSVRCFPLASRSRTEAVASPTRLRPLLLMGMPRNFRAAFTNQKVEINSLVRLQDVIEKQSVPSARRRLRGYPFGLSSSEFFV